MHGMAQMQKSLGFKKDEIYVKLNPTSKAVSLFPAQVMKKMLRKIDPLLKHIGSTKFIKHDSKLSIFIAFQGQLMYPRCTHTKFRNIKKKKRPDYRLSNTSVPTK